MFDRLRYRRADGSVFLYAFDLLDLDGVDLRLSALARAATAPESTALADNATSTT